MSTPNAAATDQWEPRSIDDRQERIQEIDQRVAELDEEFANTRMTDEARDEWNRLNSERDEHESTVAELKRRKERLRKVAGNPSATEQAQTEAPAVVRKRGDEIYDLSRIRAESRSEEDHVERLHDNAKRAIEKASFPGPSSQREQLQGHVSQLLERVDNQSGDFAKRILATGSPAYDRAFGKMLLQGQHALSSEEQRAMSVGTGTEGGFAVPFQLDPTVILTNDGSLSPLRQIARVEQTTSKTWQGITSSGITVSRSGEGTAASGNDFSIAQPEVSPTRVVADVRFSVEIDQDWAQLRNEIARLLQDAKMREEDVSFVTGDGTGNNPSGVAATLAASSEVLDDGTFDVDDLYAMEQALPVRFRQRARWLGNKSTYNDVRSLSTGSDGGDLWVRLGSGQPSELLGYPAHEASAMADNTTDGNRYLLFGDFSEFLIVDRLGMNVEVNPHVVDPSTGRWTGQRAVVAAWRNSSLVLVDNAFRALTVGT